MQHCADNYGAGWKAAEYLCCHRKRGDGWGDIHGVGSAID